MMVFEITAKQMILMFLFMAVGYFMMKKKKVPDNAASVVSKMLVMIFSTSLSFKTFATNLKPDTALEKLPLMAVSVGIVAVSFVIATLVARLISKDRMVRNIYIYSLTIPNYGYMGYPLVEAVLGEQMLLDFMIMAIPSGIFIYTVGMCMLHPNREFSLKKLLNPPMIGMAIGIVFGLCQWTLPDVILNATTSAANCMAPCAMLLTGFVLAKQPIKSMLVQKSSYAVSLLRLLGLPLLGFAVMRLIGLPQQAVILGTVFLCLPFGLNSVVFPEAYGGDSTQGARLCFLANIMALATIPTIFYLLSSVYGI